MHRGCPPQGPTAPYPYPQVGYAPGPSPAYAYPGGVSAPAPATVTHVITAPALLDCPGHMTCPYCQQLVVTTTRHKAGLLTWAICGGLTFFGCLLCSFIPFLMDSCRDVVHSCPSCRKVIHIYKRLN